MMTSGKAIIIKSKAEFVRKAMTDKVKLSKDHNHFLWIKPKDYKKYNLIPNLIKIFKAYLE